jgi:hypothetical protein
LTQDLSPKMYEEQPAIIDWLFGYNNFLIIRGPASNFKSPP